MDIDIYLQNNQSSGSVDFYTKLGFIKTFTNSVDNLPPEWQDCGNNPTKQDFYLKFVTNDTNKSEAKQRAALNGTAVNKDEFLHLYYLFGQIQTIQLAGTYNNDTEEIQCWTSSPKSLAKKTCCFKDI